MSQRSLYLFAFSFLLFVAAAIIRYESFIDMQLYAKSVDRTREVITSLEKLSNYFKSAQIYSPSYQRRIAANFYSFYEQEAELIQHELDKLNQLLQQDTLQQKSMNLISQSIGEHLPSLLRQNITELIESGEGWRLGSLLKINTTINFMVDREEQTLLVRRKALTDSLHWNNLLSLVLAAIAACIIISAFFINLRLSRQQKWLQGFLASILHTSQNGIISYEGVWENGELTDFQIVFANEAAEQLLSNKEEKLLGRKLKEIPLVVQDAHLFDVFRNVAITGERKELEAYYEQENGRQWFNMLLARRDDGITASFYDITAIKRYQKDLENTIEQLAKTNTELEQFAYAASHDLQEPLRKIQTFGSFLQERQGEKLDERGREFLQKIMLSSARMSMLIKDILGFSSLKKPIDFVPTDLNESLRNVLLDLELLITQKQATVTAQHLPVIEAIPLQMQQLFYNLLNNALKFARKDVKPEIVISCCVLSLDEVKHYKTLDPNLPYGRICFSDNGIGFNNDKAGQIFDLFKRLNSKEIFPGSGIGLALCKKVAENHHGIIYATGEEGRGARIFVLLPLRQPDHA